MWTIDKIEINGGFLPGVTLALPRGLICIIGARGSGKSTLAETLRFALKGTLGASKQRLDMLQSNLGSSGLVTLCADSASVPYTIRRSLKQAAVLLSADGHSVPNVDLDRGTFLPLDAYSGLEIEAIADETFGARRRSLLDDLRGEQLAEINLSLGSHRRSLEANGDHIRAARRCIEDFNETIEEIGDVRAQVLALGPPKETPSSAVYTSARKQDQNNTREKNRITSARACFSKVLQGVRLLQSQALDPKVIEFFEEGAPNAVDMQEGVKVLTVTLAAANTDFNTLSQRLLSVEEALGKVDSALQKVHAEQAVSFAGLQQVHLAADEVNRERIELEQRVQKLQDVENERREKTQELNGLLEERKALKAAFLLEREQISTLREGVAAELEQEAGKKVRIRVLRNADDLEYKQMLTEGLKGARVRNHDEILTALMQLRPEQLAQLIQSNDSELLDEACSFGTERARRIMDAFRENVDPLAMEVVHIEDQIRIELNVATDEQPLFKDAAELSRGQKCTALLPLLLARTDNPLIIDQPEDNLDNHFIYETVVNSIQRLKGKRQMIFITHNANIPVLAEADLIIVMNSDGKVGYIEKQGTLDECRNEIVDLLEGGTEAFELRRERYARV